MLHTSWVDNWLKEYVSDLIASFLVGPSYGWANLRLCMRFGDNVYTPDRLEEKSEHPSDESRMRAILSMLNLMGLNETALPAMWGNYKKKIVYVRHQEYELCYPEELIESLTKNVFWGCKSIGLTPFTEVHRDDFNIPLLLNQAWDVFLKNSSAYGEWEDKQIN